MVDPAAVGGTISGLVTVKDSDFPLAGVAFSLVDTNHAQTSRQGMVAATVTGTDGTYCFSNVKPGGYAVVPMKTEHGSAWQLAAAGTSASPFLTLSNDQRTVDFTAQDPSLLEGDDGTFTVTIYYDASRLPSGCQLKVERRSFNWWGGFGWFEAISSPWVWNQANPVHGLGWIQLKEPFGYSENNGWNGVDNVFQAQLLSAGNLLLAKALITLPWGDKCPANAAFFWDVAGGDGVPGTILAAPVAAPATKLEFPGRFTAQWQAVGGAYGYVLEVSTDGTFAENNGRPTLSIDAGLDTQRAVALPVAAEKKLPYYYRVIVYGEKVLSPYSGVVRVGLDEVAVPRALAVGLGINFFTAVWEPLPGAQSYRLDVSTDPKFGSFILRDMNVGASTNYCLTNLPAGGVPYYYQVRAWANGVTSLNSKTIQAGLAPLALPATSVNGGGFTANWAALAGALGYRLDVSLDPQFGSFVLQDREVGANNSFRVDNLQTGGYYYRVRGVAGSMTSANSAVIGMIFIASGMVWVPPGTFTMGSPPGAEGSWNGEWPQTIVTLTRGFWMAQTETTQAQFESVMGYNPSWFNSGFSRPVDRVTWHMATNYCGKLTVSERAAGRLPQGYAYRLPTEAEWEYACRAGSTTRLFYGADPGFDRVDNYAWIYRNSDWQTHRVGLKLPNAWGLHDMNGNVAEWCQDWLGFYRGGFATDPRGSETDSYRAVRGGDFSIPYDQVSSAMRFYVRPNLRQEDVGFRVVLSPP